MPHFLFAFLIVLFQIPSLAQTRECPTATLTAGGDPVSAGLEASDCRLSDLVTGSTNQSLAKRYLMEAREKAVFALTMAASGFGPALSIYTAQGRLVGSNSTAAIGGTARITINLPAGTYTVVSYALGTGASGTFELKAASEAPRPCLTLDLPESGTLEGAFTASSCRFVDVNEFSVNTSNVAFYRYQMPRRGVLNIAAETAMARFSTVFVTAALNGFPGGRQLTLSLAAGTGTVSVSSSETGSYTLRTKVDDLRECSQTPARLGAEVTGTLAADGCRWLDQFVPSADTTPLQLYRLTVDSRAIVQIDQTSTEVDSYLALMNPQTQAGLAFNDDASPDTADSRILIHLTPGAYVILASAFDETTLGGFTLKLAGEAPKSCDAQNLLSGAAVEGKVPDQGCRVLDYVALSTVTDIAAPFRFEATAAAMLTLKAEGAISGTLRLITPQAAESVRVAADRNGNLTTEFRVPAGTYIVLATSTAATKPFFKLGAATRAIPTCQSSPLALNAQVESVLATGECRYSELVNFATYAAPAQPFQLTVTERGRLAIEQESAAFAPALAVVSPGGDLLSLTFAGAPGRVSLVNQQAQPGEVRIVATTANSASTGSFKVRNEFTPAAVPSTVAVDAEADSGKWRRAHENPMAEVTPGDEPRLERFGKTAGSGEGRLFHNGPAASFRN